MNITQIIEPIKDLLKDEIVLTIIIIFFLAVEAVLFINWVVKKIFRKKSNSPRESELSFAKSIAPSFQHQAPEEQLEDLSPDQPLVLVGEGRYEKQKDGYLKWIED